MILASVIQKKFSSTTSLERNSQKRHKKIDCLQNPLRQTLVAPYSVKPRSHALVSKPLFWKEVDDKLDLNQFNITTLPAKLEQIGDIFHPTLKKSINIETVFKKIKKHLG